MKICCSGVRWKHLTPPVQSSVRWKHLTPPVQSGVRCFHLTPKNMGLRYRNTVKEYQCFFVTTTSKDWLSLFIDDKYYHLICDSLRFVNKQYKASIMAYVIMPNHLHIIVYFKFDNKLSDYMRDFKKFTSGEIRRMLEKDGHINLLNKLRYDHREQKFKIWQDRFDDVYLESINVIETKIDYIHENPVKKGLVKLPEEYKYSSAAFYILDQECNMPVLHYMEVFG